MTDLKEMAAEMVEARIARLRLPDGTEIELHKSAFDAPPPVEVPAPVESETVEEPKTVEEILFWSAPDSIEPKPHPEAER